jgi:hypothetical protein
MVNTVGARCSCSLQTCSLKSKSCNSLQRLWSRVQTVAGSSLQYIYTGSLQESQQLYRS